MRFKFAMATVVTGGLLAGQADAGIFSRKPKADPAEQVPSLIMQLKTDKDEAKRSTAAEELRHFDAKAFPEMMTVLSDALLKDSSVSVRAEAAATIAKLRPINPQAGYALEQAASNDPSLRVRMAARQSLWQYNLLGYRSSGKPPEAGAPTPALAVAPAPSKPHVTAKMPRGTPGETKEPPLAGEGATTSLKPVSPPKLIKPPITPAKPSSPVEPEGPSLGPPQ
ncbi:MAG: HEAT repeat domain-containing protein [Gemmataceae bacterium]|nr:HEAT repeat domain-containing protein [Gemmataceae bacterium]